MSAQVLWSRWYYTMLAGDLLTMSEAVERLQLERLYRRCGWYHLPP